MSAYVAGDDTAFEALFLRYAPVVYGMMLRHARNPALAEEFTQQTFFRVHRARHDFDTSRRLKPWLFTIAMNLVRGHWRKSSSRRHSLTDADELPSAADTSAPLEARDRENALYDAIAQLPSSQREVIELHWLQELPHKEVAEVLGVSSGAVRVRAHRAYAALRELLEQEV